MSTPSVPMNRPMRSTVFVRVTPGEGTTLASRTPNKSRAVAWVEVLDPRAGHLDGAPQAAGAGLQHAAAGAHPRAQGALQPAVHPRRVAGKDHAGVPLELRALPAGERDVGRDVVSQARTVDRRQERRNVLGDPGRQPAAHVRPRGAHRRPSSSVGPSVAVVVDLVAALPGRAREDHEDALLADRLDGERHLDGAVGGPDLRGRDPTCRPAPAG